MILLDFLLNAIHFDLCFGNRVYLSSPLSMVSSVGFILNRFLTVRRSEFSLQRTLNWSRYRSLFLIAESDHLKYTGCLWEIRSNSKNVFYWFPRSTQIQASYTCPYLQSVTTVEIQHLHVRQIVRTVGKPQCVRPVCTRFNSF